MGYNRVPAPPANMIPFNGQLDNGVDNISDILLMLHVPAIWYFQCTTLQFSVSLNQNLFLATSQVPNLILLCLLHISDHVLFYQRRM